MILKLKKKTRKYTDLVKSREMVGSRDQEGLVHPGMVHVVGDGSKQRSHYLDRFQVIKNLEWILNIDMV